ncbi:MAG: adenylate kinase, partial [Omnitrophica WOR_2 bacterium RBG_13_41_10]
PGAGKGTQAKALARKLGLSHISTGDILRQNVSSLTTLGKQAKDYMEKGGLVPDELVAAMLQERFTQADTKNGFILDGYPRNLNQAKTLDDILKEKNMGIDIVVNLEASEPVIIQRLTGRLVCSKCGLNFHIKNMPPKLDMICDNCSAKLYQRTDDQEPTIKKRLEVYHKETDGLIKYYASKQKLYNLNADESAKTVLNKIIQLVKQIHDSHKV